MTRFTLHIDSENAAFTDNDADAREAIADLLTTAAEQVRDGNTEGYLRDYNNGERVGHWTFDPNPAEVEARDLLARARDTDEPLDYDTDVYAEESVRGRKYMLSGNGPTVWFYLLKDSVGEIEMGVVEHIGFGPGTYHVMPTHDAEIVDLALRRSK